MTGAHQLQRAMPVLEVADMARSLAFYKEKLGFDADVWGAPASFAIVQRGTVTIALSLAGPSGPTVSRRTWAAYVYVDGVDAVHADFKAHGVSLAHDPVTQTSYACRDFTLDDPDGHMLAFGEVLSPDPLGPGLSRRVGRDGAGRAMG